MSDTNVRLVLSDITMAAIQAEATRAHLKHIREAIAAAEQQQQPAPLPHGIALAALECIRQAYEPGTMAHDTAHKALDDTETAREPRPAPELAAAMAESRRYREALEQVAGHHDSRVGVVRVIAKIAKRALEAK